MLKFIIRLDDACVNMNKNNWDRVESLLDKYNVKPIAGIIPDNKDKSFKYEIIEDFWTNYVKRWQEKKWTIALHGLHHDLSTIVRTEYSGKSLEEQKEMLTKGYNILMSNGIKPDCFFAPNHTFDKNTIKACKELGYFKFISDGNAFFPYKKDGIIFLPNVFDTPHKISNSGIFTFVYHPNNMKEADFVYLENFIKNNYELFDANIDEILEKFENRKRSFFDMVLSAFIQIYRILLNTKR